MGLNGELPILGAHRSRAPIDKVLGHAHLANFGELVLLARKHGPVHLLKVLAHACEAWC